MISLPFDDFHYCHSTVIRLKSDKKKHFSSHVTDELISVQVVCLMSPNEAYCYSLYYNGITENKSFDGHFC